MKNKLEAFNIIKIIISISIILLAILHLLGYIHQTIQYIIPLFGINLIIIYFEDKKTNPTNATISICFAMIAFIFSIYIWFI